MTFETATAAAAKMIVTNAVIFFICLHVTFSCKHGSGKSKALSELYKSVRPRENYTNCCKQVAEKIAKDDKCHAPGPGVAVRGGPFYYV